MSAINNYANAKLIKGYPGYAVTNCGKILSLPRKVVSINPITQKKIVYEIKEVKELKSTLGTRGHPKVHLCINGKQKTCYVKNLVAEAYCIKPKGKNLIVWHLDEIKTHNEANNLSYIPFAQLCLLTNQHNYRSNFKK